VDGRQVALERPEVPLELLHPAIVPRRRSNERRPDHHAERRDEVGFRMGAMLRGGLKHVVDQVDIGQ
jgi:hypothetical protein